MIANVFRFANDQVLVFDEQGQQMPEFQGDFKDVKDKILFNMNHLTQFFGWRTPLAWPTGVPLTNCTGGGGFGSCRDQRDSELCANCADYKAEISED